MLGRNLGVCVKIKIWAALGRFENYSIIAMAYQAVLKSNYFVFL